MDKTQHNMFVELSNRRWSRCSICIFFSYYIWSMAKISYACIIISLKKVWNAIALSVTQFVIQLKSLSPFFFTVSIVTALCLIALSGFYKLFLLPGRKTLRHAHCYLRDLERHVFQLNHVQSFEAHSGLQIKLDSTWDIQGHSKDTVTETQPMFPWTVKFNLQPDTIRSKNMTCAQLCTLSQGMTPVCVCPRFVCLKGSVSGRKPLCVFLLIQQYIFVCFSIQKINQFT